MTMNVKDSKKGQAIPSYVVHIGKEAFDRPEATEIRWLSGSAVKLCDAYPNAPLIPIHWGSVDAPDWFTFNGDPRELKRAIVNPDRLHVLVPGEAYTLSKKGK